MSNPLHSLTRQLRSTAALFRAVYCRSSLRDKALTLRLIDGADAPRQFLRYVAERAMALADVTDQKDFRKCQVASALVRAGDFDHAKAVIERIGSKAAMESGLHDIAMAYASAGQGSQALDIANRLQDEFARGMVVESIARMACSTGRVDEFMMMVGQIQEAEARNSALKTLVDELAKTGNADQAIAVINRFENDFEDDFERVNAVDSVVRTLCSVGRAGALVTLVGQIQGARARNSGFRVLACELAKTGNADQAIAVINRLESDFEGDIERVEAADSVVRTLCSVGRAGELVTLVCQIQGARARSSGFRVLACELAKAGRVEQSVTASSQIDDKFGRSDTFQEVGKILFEAGKLPEFSAALAQLQEPEARLSARSALVAAFARNGNMREAVNIANSIWPNPIGPNASITFSPVFSGAFAKGPFSVDTLLLGEQIQNREIRDRFWRAAAPAFVQSGQAHEFATAVLRFDDIRIRDSAFDSLVNVLITSGNLDLTASIPGQMTDEKHQKEARERLAIASAEIETQNQEPFEKVIERLKRGILANDSMLMHLVVDEVIELATKYWGRGAKGAAKSAIGLFALINERFDRESALGTIGSRLAEAGKVEMLFESLDVIRNPQDRDAALSAAIEQLASKGDLELACDCLSKIQDRDAAECPIAGAYARAASRLLESRKPKAIVSAIGRLSHRPNRDKFRAAVALGLSRAGDHENARGLIAQIEDGEERKQAVGALSVFNWENARSFAQVIALAECLENGLEKDLFLESEASAMEKAGRTSEALRTRSHIRSPIVWSVGMWPVYVSELQEIIRSGQIDRAIEMASKPKDHGARSTFLTVAAEEMVQSGKCDRLAEVVSEAIKSAKRIKEKDLRAIGILGIAAVVACRPIKTIGREPKQSFNATDKQMALCILKALLA